MKKKVMVTGGLGFIGSHLTRYLSQSGVEVLVIARSRNAHFDEVSSLPRVKIVIKQIKDLEKSDFEHVEQIYHLASTVHNYHILTDPFIDYKTNIEGTIQVLNQSKDLGNIEIILASSWFVYGHQHILPVKEDAKCQPLALYGATKLCSEHCVQAYGRVFGIPHKIIRFGNIYGLGDINANKQKGAMLYLLKQIKANESINLYYGGDFIRDFLYVEDAIKGIICVAEKGLNGETYNIGSGVPIQFNKIIKFAIKYFNSKSEIISIDPPPFHQAVQTKDFYLNIDKIKTINFTPQISLEKGLDYVCRNINQ